MSNSNISDADSLETAVDKMDIGSMPIHAVPRLLDLVFAMPKKMTVCLVGETGIGKTPIVAQWAGHRGAKVTTLNFGHMSAEDISMAMFSEDAAVFRQVPPEVLVRINADAERDGCAVLFLDEFNRGDRSVVNGMFTLPDERRIHDLHLHPNVLVVAAMNPSDGAYQVNNAERDHAIRKRLCFVAVRHDLAGWLEHARRSNFHDLVIRFVQAMSHFFYDTAARDAGKAFACPSSWEKVSNVLKAADVVKVPLTSVAVQTLVQGQIGATAGNAFMDFVRDESTVIQPSDILENYFGTVDPSNPGRLRVAKQLGTPIASPHDPLPKNGTGIRTDIISVLNTALANALLVEQPDPTSIAKNFVAYLLDIPESVFMAFWSQQFNGLLKEDSTREERNRYAAALQSALKVYPDYQKRMTQMIARQRQLSEELRSGSTPS